MANHLASSDVLLTIPEAVNDDGVTNYVIKVEIGDVHWTVKHRYRDFATLHDSLVEAGVAKDSLPEKKYIGNKEPSFIMKRRRELEAYLQSVLKFLIRSLPHSLVVFLDLNKFDINFILRDIAAKHFDRTMNASDPESLNLYDEEADWTPMQLHAVSERMKSPVPPMDMEGARNDFTNVADLVCQLKSVRIRGSDNLLGTSNIVPNQLKFDFVAFKNLTQLVLLNLNCSSNIISSLGKVRETLRSLAVNKCNLKSTGDILLCDVKSPEVLDDHFLNDERIQWPNLETLDLRHNAITGLDQSLKLAPKIKALLLGNNKIKTIENLSSLTNLTELELYSNDVSKVDDLNQKIGQIERIDLSHNKVNSLEGFSKLYSLKKLNVAANRIKDLDSVFHVSSLPCLEELNLQGNLVTTVVDYRLKVFESFGKRCSDLCLDNEGPSQSEVDKVSVMMALRVAKEGLPPTSLFGNLPRRVQNHH